jgi:hypothetical protein
MVAANAITEDPIVCTGQEQAVFDVGPKRSSRATRVSLEAVHLATGGGPVDLGIGPIPPTYA